MYFGPSRLTKRQVRLRTIERMLAGGTKGSNPLCSRGESGELLYSAAGSSRSRRQCANEETSAVGRMALFHHLIGAGEDRLGLAFGRLRTLRKDKGWLG